MGKKKHILIDIEIFIFVVILLLTTLYAPEPVGLSDNGDFSRVMVPNLLSYKIDDANKLYLFNSEYTMLSEKPTVSAESASESIDPYYSSTFLFVDASKSLNSVYNSSTGSDPQNYNIFWLGLLYILIYAFAITLILSAIRTNNVLFNIIAFLLVILVLCDTGYTLYFNSFYGEALQHCAIILCLGAAGKIIRNKGSVIFISIFFIADLLFITAKHEDVPVGIIIALLGCFFILFYNKIYSRIIIISGVVLLLSFSILYLSSMPSWMNNVTNYQSVFFGILKDSPTPESDLSDLGLPAEYALLKNTNFFMTGQSIDIQSNEFKYDFFTNVSKGSIVKFYALHPARFMEKINISCLNSSSIRPSYLGNYGSNHERAELTDRFSLWSDLRVKLDLNKASVIFFTIFIFLMMIILFIRRYIQFKSKQILLLICSKCALLLSLMFSLVIPILGNGEADLAKHMFGFIQLFDIVFLAIVLSVLFVAIRGRVFNEISDETRRLYLKLYIVFIIIPFILFGFVSNGIEKFENNITISNSGKLINGSCISLGKYGGEDIRWHVINTDNNTALLLSDTVVNNIPFDIGNSDNSLFGSNDWQNSSIRKWLNNDFISGFSDSEKQLINESNNRCSLTNSTLHEKVGGTRPLYWNVEPALADSGYDDAYYKNVIDKVFILDVKQYHQFVADSKISESANRNCWLRTPYYSNDSMVRYVSNDGYILYKDASAKSIGIVPAINIDLNTPIFSGNGTDDSPFVLANFGADNRT